MPLGPCSVSERPKPPKRLPVFHPPISLPLHFLPRFLHLVNQAREKEYLARASGESQQELLRESTRRSRSPALARQSEQARGSEAARASKESEGTALRRCGQAGTRAESASGDSAGLGPRGRAGGAASLRRRLCCARCCGLRGCGIGRGGAAQKATRRNLPGLEGGRGPAGCGLRFLSRQLGRGGGGCAPLGVIDGASGCRRGAARAGGVRLVRARPSRPASPP